MKHENFKSFKDAGALSAFINAGHITAKSISISKGITVIGFSNSKAEHHYKIVEENFTPSDNLEEIDALLEAAAAKHSGVVCQHVDLEDCVVTFLVAE